jgi:hypothetical protein
LLGKIAQHSPNLAKESHVMFHRIALAALLIACFAVSASAQKDKPPKPRSATTWETVAADEAGKMTTRRASVPGGWLVLVQIGEDVSLTFLPDAAHRWSGGDGSPADVKTGKPTSEDATKAAVDKLTAELEETRAAAVAERKKAEAALAALLEVEIAAKKAERLTEEARASQAAALREAEKLAARAAQEAAKAKAEAKKLQAELDQARKDVERLKALLDKSK